MWTHTQAPELHGLQRKDHVRAQGRSSHFQAKQRGLEMVGETNLACVFILDSSSRNCEKITSITMSARVQQLAVAAQRTHAAARGSAGASGSLSCWLLV